MPNKKRKTLRKPHLTWTFIYKAMWNCVDSLFKNSNAKTNFGKCCWKTKVIRCGCCIRNGGWNGRWAGGTKRRIPDGGQSGGRGRWAVHARLSERGAPPRGRQCNANGSPGGRGGNPTPMTSPAWPSRRTLVAPRRRERVRVRPQYRQRRRWAGATVAFSGIFH